MGFKRQRFPHLLPSKLHGFGFLPWRDLHPQVCATLRWARQYLSLTPIVPKVLYLASDKAQIDVLVHQSQEMAFRDQFVHPDVVEHGLASAVFS